MTVSGDSQCMRRLAATIAALSLLASAGSTAASGAGGVPPFPRLGGQWSHAEINVRIARHVHTLILDRGKIVQATPTQITLREADGTMQTIDLDDQTIVRIDGRNAFSSDLRRKMSAQTMIIDGGAAVRVVATSK